MPDSLSAPRGGGVGNGALLTGPNCITVARLCMVPLAVWLVLHARLDLAFGVFVLAGLSDALDGWLARRGAASALGAMLDPMADKLLLVAMFITLAVVGVLPDWLAILVVFRDLLIVGGVLVLWLLGQPMAIRPMAISKTNTALQIGVVALALGLTGFRLGAPLLLQAATWLVAASTLVTGAAYVWKVARSR